VTADGQLVRASSAENADLFWGLRGGGGNFGVVTGIDYELFPVGPEIVGGVVAWPASEAPKVLEFYRTLAEAALPELTLVALMRPAPQQRAPERDAWEADCGFAGLLLAVRPRRARRPLPPSRRLASPSATCSCADRTHRFNRCSMRRSPRVGAYYWKSEYLSRIEPALCQKVIEHAGKIQSALFRGDPVPNRRCP